MRRVKVFVDSDVVISSLLSQKGAAYLLLSTQKPNFIISDFSKKELEKVALRLRLEQSQLQDLIRKKFKVIKLKKEMPKIKEEYKNYSTDVDDTHIIAGAKSVRAKFLLTYNVKHFQRQKIREDLGIIVLTPAQYLQYLRSLD